MKRIIGMSNSKWFPISLMALGLVLTGEAGRAFAENNQPNQVIVSEKRFRKEYVFGVGDQLEVLVRKVPEASRTVTIRPDGFVTLPLIDTVKAAGLTAPELKVALTEALGHRLVAPEVNVIAVQTRPPTVYVSGDVNAPIPVPLRTASTAMQAITAAGGFRRSAATRSVYVIRLGEDGHLNAIPVTPAVKGQVGSYLALGEVPLQADDIIFVPESRRSQVTRFIDDMINRPLQGVNSMLSIYFNFKLIEAYTRIQ